MNCKRVCLFIFDSLVFFFVFLKLLFSAFFESRLMREGRYWTFLFLLLLFFLGYNGNNDTRFLFSLIISLR